MKWLRFWYVPVLLAITVIGWFVFRKVREKGTPLAQTKLEVRAIRAETETQKLAAKLGLKKAREHVEVKYSAALESLRGIQRKQARELRHDPAKLAKFLVRAAGNG